MVPIYYEPAIVPHAVLEEEKAIIAAEGWFHVAGKYIASAPDADKARRIEAERRIAERPLPVCAMCFQRISRNVEPIEIAFRQLHPECADEFAKWWSSNPRENDLRWFDVTDATPVEFEGEICAWGDLMLADRKTVEMLADGRLVGGYPF